MTTVISSSRSCWSGWRMTFGGSRPSCTSLIARSIICRVAAIPRVGCREVLLGAVLDLPCRLRHPQCVIIERGRRLHEVHVGRIKACQASDDLLKVATRVIPEHGVRVGPGTSSWQLDPRVPPGMRSDPMKERGEGFGRKPYSAHNLIINACRPYEWKDDFPRVNVNSPQLRRATEEKWRELFES